MTWEAAAAVASALFAGVAIAVTVLGQRKADARGRDADARAEEAHRFAQRSAEAADRSANAVERMAAALERRDIEAERSASTPGVAWQLEHFQNDAYVLINAGRATAYDVQVKPEGHMIVGDLPDGATVAPGGLAKFMASRTLATLDDTLTVTWANRPGGERITWSRPLPPSPISRHIASMSPGAQAMELLRLSSASGTTGGSLSE